MQSCTPVDLGGLRGRKRRNGRVALDLVREFRPDLVLCDVMMPELDGFGVLKALREDEGTESIPLVFLTALDDKENLRKAMGHGRRRLHHQALHARRCLAGRERTPGATGRLAQARSATRERASERTGQCA